MRSEGKPPVSSRSTKIDWINRFVFGAATFLICLFFSTPTVPSDCMRYRECGRHTTQSWVCTEASYGGSECTPGGSETTVYMCCEQDFTQGTDRNAGGGLPVNGNPIPEPAPPEPPADDNQDGRLDCLVMMFSTPHPEGPRTGTCYGGPNANNECHTGVDFPCNQGYGVRAPCSGTITRSGVTSSGAWVVVIAYEWAPGFPPGYACETGHFVPGSTLAGGTHVLAGDHIGQCGNSGTTQTHVHYRVYIPDSMGTPPLPAGCELCPPTPEMQIIDPDDFHPRPPSCPSTGTSG